MDITIRELIKVFELVIDKEKFESMIVAQRITSKDDPDEEN
jgi:hypothetical protein